MRIISGSHKGRIISAPISFIVRPTTDIAKEGLFNALYHLYDFEELSVLDLFGGIGGISFEFASRGCNKVVCVEKNNKHAQFIRAENEKLKFSTPLVVFQQDVQDFLKNNTQTFDIIFADPPYDLPWIQDIPELIQNSNAYNNSTLLIVEHPVSVDYSKNTFFIETRSYGKVHFSWFEKQQ